jgi:ATP-binding cassette subfamily F protein 3
MIYIENLTKSYDRQVLFDGISFKLNPKEKIGIVGRNGHGKTTLFQLITGQEHPDAGKIVVPKHYRIGYVLQELKFTKDTILAEAMTGLPDEQRDHHWKAEKILAGLGFGKDDLKGHPEEFSGGFQVRLSPPITLISLPYAGSNGF